jgi:hypothetical protein
MYLWPGEEPEPAKFALDKTNAFKILQSKTGVPVLPMIDP